MSDEVLDDVMLKGNCKGKADAIGQVQNNIADAIQDSTKEVEKISDFVVLSRTYYDKVLSCIEDIEKIVTLNPEIYSLGLEDELANKINQPIINYSNPVENIKYDILDTNGRFNPTTGVDLNTKRDYDNYKEGV